MVQDTSRDSIPFGTDAAHRADPSARARSQEQIRNALAESRMVLPGIQALFGFQLISVFSDGFARLDEAARIAHFVSLLLVIVATALIMTPAAYDRFAAERESGTEFLKFTSRLLTGAMGVFAFAIGVELSVIAYVVTSSPVLSVAVGGVATAAMLALWFGCPLRDRALGRL